MQEQSTSYLENSTANRVKLPSHAGIIIVFMLLGAPKALEIYK